MDTSGLTHAAVLPVDVHGNSGDIDSLLSSDPSDAVATGGGNAPHGMGTPHSGASDLGDGKMRRLYEPYERHRAHDLRAECYRRGIRPIKKGPNANDNKNGYIALLRKYDGTGNGLGALHTQEDRGGDSGAASTHGPPSGDEDMDEGDGDSDSTQSVTLVKKRKLPSQHTQSGLATATSNANDLAGFYDTTQPSLVPVLPMQYTNLVKPANPTTDLEILSGIANTYTTQTAAAGVNANPDGAAFCGNCRTVVTEQLMESIRLGRNKMQLLETQKLLEQRDRDTVHLKEVIYVLRDLRQSFRDAQTSGTLTHELMMELEDDIAFFQTLKERTKDRMRKEMQDARDRAAKQATSASLGGSGGVGPS
ncbi:hypothetical protein Poli38472_000154 [Pythium oligandrum]|uniref:Uncharacterized protein n=1 Tax=Pythium oligandrum TaxID=41045 RepID=A0A8K1CBF5_PYTOL|nr:hypothetical protein Poli38472_000154 [Pythium oligandrum]|eukprot:TMW60112.1 hypothetical protein Poli38472_000154 [Pythium oligandrum]